MCIIAVKKKGIRQPNKEELLNMFSRNPDGAGFMVARNGKVEIHKGFMEFGEFINAVNSMNFTDDDVIVYHFRISTQGGVNREMCQPFGQTRHITETKALDVLANVGIAHNGIIPMTTDHRDKEYSDTAHFVSEYLPWMVRTPKDIKNPFILDCIEEIINSKMVLMDGKGYISLIGKGWIHEDSGLIFSNSTYRDAFTYRNVKSNKPTRFSWLDYNY